MKCFRIIYIAMLALLSVGCADEIYQKPDIENNDRGDSLEIQGSVFIPGMQMASTRGQFGDYPADGSLKLTILEFTVGDDAQSSFMTHIYNAECTSTTAVGNGGIVNFKVTLNGTTEARKLHLIVADDYVLPEFGSEASVFTSTGMTVGPNAEAYWGSVLVEDGYVSVTQNSDGSTVTTPKTDYIKGLLTTVPVVRNFAKVTVTESVDNFEVLGWVLVNVPTRGTIVPWDASTLSVPELLSGNSMMNFSDLSYGGIIPGNAGFSNQETDNNFKNSSATSGNQITWSTGSRYLYEHPYESTRHTYLVIYGRYNSTPGYYKVDFGKQTNIGFEYYNIIRNYNYQVTITSVNAIGFTTLAAAIEGRVFNNITADVKMLSVSDGENMLTVDATKHVFIQNGTTMAEPYSFTAAYIYDVTGSQTVNSTNIMSLGLVPGDVIASVDSTTTAGNKVYRITPKVLGTYENEKTQSFQVFDGNGLGRVITLILARPYQYSNVIVNQGTSNLPVSSTSQSIGQGQGDAFTLYFNLPDGMPEEIFPLTFQIESEKQILENNHIGTLTVSTGASLFNPSVPAISYLKTVTYNEYRYRINSDNEVDLSSYNTNHTIRCRFKTINAGTGTDNIMLHDVDGYFNNYTLTVNR